MQLGSVFTWNSFPFREEGKEKNRYLRIPEYPDGNSEGIRTLNR